jgi:hypothetical protein
VISILESRKTEPGAKSPTFWAVVRAVPFALSGLLLISAAFAEPGKVIVDNDRVLVREVAWDQQNSSMPHEHDTVTICLTCASNKSGAARFEAKGTTHGDEKPVDGKPATSIVIELKDHIVPPLANKTGYQNAFPRPGSVKLFENAHIIVWDYHWTPGKPSPMHFHDKDVVVVYLDNGALKSTTPDGKSTVNEITFGLTKFNARDRTHTEEVVRGNARAVMMELK